MELKNKTALITGGRNGIGKAIAQKLASMGADIIVNSRKLADNQLTDSLQQLYGVKSRSFTCDISDIIQVSAMVKDIIVEFGKIDILVNNAGIYPPAPFWETTEEQFDKIIGVNLKGTFFITQEVVKRSMIPSASGKIICISSIDGWMPSKGVSAYAASKAGINSLVKSFALELAEYNITSNAVAPGWVATDSVLKAARWKDVIKNIPCRRLATFDEIANIVAFLASEKSSYINGEIINVNGGLLMK